MKKILPLCVLVIMSASVAAHARPMHSRAHRKRNANARVVLISSQRVDKVKSLVSSLHDLAKRSSHGSYSVLQRRNMNVEFQSILATIDSTVNSSAVRGVNMLNYEDRIVVVKVRRQRLEFQCVDLTREGLNLDGEISIESAGIAQHAYECTKMAMRKLILTELQFDDYLKVLSDYFSWIKPLNKEVQLRLEIVEASKERAVGILLDIIRVTELLDKLTDEAYSENQKMIMNYKLRESLTHIDYLANEDYYFGMEMINSTDIVTVDVGDDELELSCFDLTLEGLCLDVEPCDTLNPDMQVYDCTKDALRLVSQAITAFDRYRLTLLKYL